MGDATKGEESFMFFVSFDEISISDLENPAYPGTNKMSSKVRDVGKKVFWRSIINNTMGALFCQYRIIMIKCAHYAKGNFRQ